MNSRDFGRRDTCHLSSCSSCRVLASGAGSSWCEGPRWKFNCISYCQVHSRSSNPHVSYLSGSKHHLTLGWEIWKICKETRNLMIDWPNPPCSGPSTPNWNPSNRPSLSLGEISFGNREKEPGWKNMAGKSVWENFLIGETYDDLLQLQLQDLFGVPQKFLNTKRLPKIYSHDHNDFGIGDDYGKWTGYIRAKLMNI